MKIKLFGRKKLDQNKENLELCCGGGVLLECTPILQVRTLEDQRVHRVTTNTPQSLSEPGELQLPLILPSPLSYWAKKRDS